MKPNLLKLSDNKTELLCVTRKGFRTMPVSASVTIGDCCIQPSNQVRNLGVRFDEHMTMGPQVSAVCSSGHFHLRNSRTIRRYLTVDSAACLVHAFISSRLDQGNALLYPQSTGSHDFRDHRTCRFGLSLELRSKARITPVMKMLNW